MGAVVLKEGKKIGVANVAAAKLARPSDVVVRVTLAAICVTGVPAVCPVSNPALFSVMNSEGSSRKRGPERRFPGRRSACVSPRSVAWHLPGVLVLHVAQLSRAIHV